MSRGVYRQWPYDRAAQKVPNSALLPPNFPVDTPLPHVPIQAYTRNYDSTAYQPAQRDFAPILDAFRKDDDSHIAPGFAPNLACYQRPTTWTPQVFPDLAALLAPATGQGNGDTPPAPLTIARYAPRLPYPNQQGGLVPIAATAPQAQGNGDSIPPTPILYPPRQRPYDYRLPPPSALAAALSPGVLFFGPRYTFDWDPIFPGRRWRLMYLPGRVAGYTDVRPDATPPVPDVPPPKLQIPEAAYQRRNDGRLQPLKYNGLAFLPLLQGNADVPPTYITYPPAPVPYRYPQQVPMLTAWIPQSQGLGDTPPPAVIARVPETEAWQGYGRWNPATGWLAAIEDTEVVVGPDLVQPLAAYDRPRYPRIEAPRYGISALLPQPQGGADVPPGPLVIARYERRYEYRSVLPPPFFTQGTDPVPQAPPAPLYIARYPPPPDVRTRYIQTFVLQPGVVPPDIPSGLPLIARVPRVSDDRARLTPLTAILALQSPLSIGYVPPLRVQQPDRPWRPMPQLFVRIAPFFADITAPSVPVQTAATVISDTAIDVNWNASTDAGSGVAGYFVYINGVKFNAFPVAGVIYHRTGLSPGTTYAFQVSAFDNAGNESGLSNVVFATTTGGSVGGLVITRRWWRRRGG